MIQVAPQMRILLAVEPADFRKGIDGLSQVCRKVLSCDPFSGYIFIFRNKRASAIKILMYDGQGFWLCQKRLSKGRFQWWTDNGKGIDWGSGHTKVSIYNNKRCIFKRF
jgi:transposase